MTDSESEFEAFCSSDEQSNIKKGTITYRRVDSKNGLIVLMDHPSSITVYNHVVIEVLSGSVSILGYEIANQVVDQHLKLDSNELDRSLKVFSSEKTGLIEVKTETYERVWKKKCNFSNLEQTIDGVVENRRITLEILEKFGNSTVAIFIKRIPYPNKISFIELYIPELFQFNMYYNKLKEYFCIRKYKEASHEPIRYGINEEKVMLAIDSFIRTAKMDSSDAPRIVVCGPKGTGKSSFLRLLLNRIVSAYKVAFYLDADPGQAEFTPPGVVSLVKVTKPVIGPPFYHQRKPVSMVFNGSTTVKSSDIYSKCILKLAKLHRMKHSEEPLFVNTMGWMEGVGLQCLGNVLKIVQPSILVEIVTKEDNTMFDYREYLPQGSHYFQLTCAHDRTKPPYFSGAQMRDLSLLAYFGKCQSPVLQPVSIHDIKPYIVCWDKIAIHIYHSRLERYRMVEALAGSVVALCAVPEHAILESDIPQYPRRTLENEADNECLGYGIVKAIDERDHLLYIVTPLKMDQLARVNAIIKGTGDIKVPDCVNGNQKVFGVPLPFTEEIDILPPATELENLDCSSVSLKSLSFTESPFSNQRTPSSLCYGKKIPKRHSLRKK